MTWGFSDYDDQMFLQIVTEHVTGMMVATKSYLNGIFVKNSDLKLLAMQEKK